jgi:hypothetical protein
LGRRANVKHASVVSAVDADSGIVFPPERASPGVSAAGALEMAIIKAIESSRALAAEVRVQSGRFKDCLNPISETRDYPIKDVGSPPALMEAREHRLRLWCDPVFPEV